MRDGGEKGLGWFVIADLLELRRSLVWFAHNLFLEESCHSLRLDDYSLFFFFFLFLLLFRGKERNDVCTRDGGIVNNDYNAAI